MHRRAIRQAKTKTASVEKLALEVRIQWMGTSVDVIADDRMTDEGKMDPDLMGASSFN